MRPPISSHGGDSWCVGTIRLPAHFKRVCRCVALIPSKQSEARNSTVPHRGKAGDAGGHGEEVGARQVAEIVAADADAIEQSHQPVEEDGAHGLSEPHANTMVSNTACLSGGDRSALMCAWHLATVGVVSGRLACKQADGRRTSAPGHVPCSMQSRACSVSGRMPAATTASFVKSHGRPRYTSATVAARPVAPRGLSQRPCKQHWAVRQ